MRTHSAWVTTCGRLLCNRLTSSLCITSTFVPRVHYLGVLRQELYPCFLTKISFLLTALATTVRRFAWTLQDPNNYSLATLSHCRLISSVLSNQPDLFCCRASIILVHLGARANNASIRSFKRMAAGVWRPYARLNGVSALLVSSDSLFGRFLTCTPQAIFFRLVINEGLISALDYYTTSSAQVEPKIKFYNISVPHLARVNEPHVVI
jgi:hypothetical protein